MTEIFRIIIDPAFDNSLHQSKGALLPKGCKQGWCLKVDIERSYYQCFCPRVLRSVDLTRAYSSLSDNTVQDNRRKYNVETRSTLEANLVIFGARSLRGKTIELKEIHSKTVQGNVSSNLTVSPI